MGNKTKMLDLRRSVLSADNGWMTLKDDSDMYTMSTDYWPLSSWSNLALVQMVKLACGSDL